VLRQVRIDLGIAQIVYRDDLHLAGALALVHGTQHVAADAAVAVDSHFDCHEPIPLAIFN
jgi:hypothetical protein